MKSNRWLLAAGLILAIGAGSLAQTAPDASFEDVVSRAAQALARLEYTYFNELVGAQKRMAQCVCIDAANGVFLTRDIPGTVPTDEMKNFVLLPPGRPEERVEAELMGVDPEKTLAFVKAKGKHGWKDVQFVLTDLALGQQVISVGLLGPQTGSVPYMGTARVAAKLRLPNEMIYVSGGDLTNMSSPVFTTDGRAVGFVAGQVPMEYQMLLRGRWTDVGLAARQGTRFFAPASDFAHVLRQIPQKGKTRKLPWMGVWGFKKVSPDESEFMGLGGKPAILVGQLMNNGPADVAGIKQGDAIVALNGQPLEELPTPELTAGAFQRRLYRLKPGSKAKFTIFRDKKQLEVEMTLAEMPAQPHEAPRFYNKDVGIAVRELVPSDRYANRATPLLTPCVRVTLVRQKSPAANGGLRPGDHITAVGDQPVDSVEAMKKALAAVAGKNQSVSFMVQRGDSSEPLMIQVP